MMLEVAGSPAYAYTGTRPWVAQAPVLVFVHGAAHDHSVWALQSRYFAHHGWNVLALDLPAHGRSEGEPLPSVERLGDWLVAVLDAAGARQAAIVGHSMGALAALDCAGRHPDRIRQIALLGPAVPMEVSDALMEAAQQDEALAFELINGWSFSAGKQLGGSAVPGMWLTGNALRLMQRTRRGVLAVDLLACRNYQDGVAAAANVRCAALVLMGARDLMAPTRNAKALLAALPNVQSMTLPDCGHSLMSEQPDAVLDALRAFLRP